MRGLTVARKDYLDAIQSRTLWALTLLLVTFTVGLGYAIDNFGLLAAFWPIFIGLFGAGQGGQLSTISFIDYFVGPAQILIPLVALIISYKSISGEVESGSAKILLSVPLTRWDALIGKVIGRAAVLSTALAAGLGATGVLLALFTGRIQFGPYVALLFFTLLFGISYISIGVSISAITDTQQRAVAYVVAVYLFLIVAMEYVNNVIYFVLEGRLWPLPYEQTNVPDVDAWWWFVPRLKPGGAYNAVVTSVVGAEPKYAPLPYEEVPFYLDPSVSLIILLVWIVAPIAVGYLVLKEADLG